jgi:hypothetical protein
MPQFGEVQNLNQQKYSLFAPVSTELPPDALCNVPPQPQSLLYKTSAITMDPLSGFVKKFCKP